MNSWKWAWQPGIVLQNLASGWHREGCFPGAGRVQVVGAGRDSSEMDGQSRPAAGTEKGFFLARGGCG